MKLALFNDYVLGIIRDSEIVSIQKLFWERESSPQSRMEDLIARWDHYQPQIDVYLNDAPGVPLSSVRLRAPLPRPSKILCAVANYKEGIEGNVSELDFFHKSPSAVIGDGETLVLPRANVTIVHHELELGVVIGKTCKDVSENDALQMVFGYTIVQDGSARGLLTNGQMSFFTQKSWDTFAPIGPMIVTADEISDPHELQVRLWANGELRQDYNTSDMAHRIPRLIATASTFNTLYPGDIIATGCNRQGLGPMQDGDVIVQEITGLGKLTTLVSDPLKRKWPYGIDAEFADFVRKPRSQRGSMGPPRIVPAGSRTQV
ncbi:2-keto-4-pentenoate hydratase/2-oxohepta-3-ene-1,7-dioic acid hydratase in catechol pathway [Bradyrhizobium macuxiense]|uniref:2-keto-4-pentenoate hydratase/2-oxohepta-3-ene-1,7-dioic acid hydratase in catechol pathway n=1 Tax=Bradyrhizobium macuxiense TaxID=1755647 RepID=A0A560L3T1_9BRAD|nr:fumarylacetoacetate hydrolase family protein [Bradyrhizobium macuxiense]TWB87820.1 2-keto-4-pentenoate hydratase/2-oxohepta-3-ene-1,7-dioic acid hydratase in catechol pathway [Bradyrhizobium macuxiense]